MEYWLGVLQAQIPTVMEKAIASESHTKGAQNFVREANPTAGVMCPSHTQAC